MAALGHAILIIAFLLCLYGAGASIYGVRTGANDWIVSGRRSVYTLAVLMVIAFALVEDAFIANNFHFRIVASSSATTIPLYYRMAAPWSSQQGSLLLWVTLLSFWSSIVLFLTRRRMREIAPYATATLLGFAAFFDGLAIFYSNPFSQLPAGQVPVQGNGLDPLLMHPTMMIHPPMLYTGYTLMAVPFAFAVGALISGRLNSEWIRDTRRFALAAWLALGTGIMLGMLWSYTELGWGGYWGWDAVENAALLPWLTMTAFIHSIQIQEKRGMLKVWNVSLVLLSGVLTIFGTFLVRSGVLDSIHAFGASTLGVPFVILLAVMFFGSIGLVLWRRDSLRTEHRIDALLSREAAFLLQNVVLVALVFVIFWITVFPLISQALTGTKVSVGPPAFAPFVVPLGLALVLLTGVGPMISWRRATVANLRKNFVFPVSVGMIVLVLCLSVLNTGGHLLATLMFGFGAFVIAGVVQEFHRGASVRRTLTHRSYPASMYGLVRRNRRRYGGYLVHLGFAAAMIGVAASSAFEHSNTVTLAPGQSTVVGHYRFSYVRPTESVSSEKVVLGALINVTQNGRHVTTLRTERGIYPNTADAAGDGIVGQYFDTANADTTVGLDTGPLKNIWSVVQSEPTTRMVTLINSGNRLLFKAEATILARTRGESAAAQDYAVNHDPIDGLTLPQIRNIAVAGIARQYVTHPIPVQFLLIVSPMVMWLWLGGAMMVLGAVISLWPAPLAARRRELALYRSRLARELA
ncbi:heme lyase CcmF/NrfE family subunit [Conexibacter sp. DBS9H8]|uniref:heme lyase CcmF/NrfE family subunit n=1 Tax=Conexibacter sp. DBS9H8 TaxID=2937801 RepID=UPI00200D0C67|nr:cytochrome c-type biogenesis CcmF C-terminal domain-containing protein [Conexibacter sp. DBS9H8]